MRNKNYLILLFLLLSFGGFSQNSYDISGGILWSMIHETGILLVGTSNGLYSIDPTDSSSHFIESKSPIQLDKLEIISESPYLVASREVIETKEAEKGPVKSKSGFGRFLEKQADGLVKSSIPDTVATFTLIDVFDGKILFDAYESGYKDRSRSLLAPDLNGYFFIAKKEKEQQAVFIDLESGEKKWSFSLPNRSIGDLISRTLLQPIATSHGDIVFPYGKEIYVLDAQDGSLKWVKEYPSINDIISLDNGKTFALVDSKGISNTKSIITALDATNGHEVWQKPYRNKGVYAFGMPLEDGLFIVSYLSGGSGDSQILDYKTGNPIWPKASRSISSSPISEYPDFVSSTDEEIIFVVKVSRAGGPANSIEYFKSDGSPAWKKGANVSENLYYFNILDDGILYVDDKEVNIISKSNGKPVFKKIINIKKGTTLTVENKMANKLIIYNENTLYELDTKTGEYRILAQEIAISNKEDFTSIQLLEKGYLLSAIRTALYVDFDGNEIYRKDFEDPYKGNRAGSFFKSLGLSLAGAVLATTVTMGKVGFLGSSEGQKYIANDLKGESYKNAGYEAVSDASNAVVANTFKAQNKVDDARKRARDQRQKSLTIQNSLVFVGKAPGGEASLIQLEPESGEQVQTILLNDTSPFFKVDDVNKVVYYFGSNSIQMFSLK